VKPSQNWGEGKHGALGASVRYENYMNAHKNLLRVLTVNEGSLAQKIGLKPIEDFIIALRPENEDIVSLNAPNKDPLTYFKAILKENVGKNIEFFIYSEKHGPRSEKIMLEVRDNGEIMGCDIGYGKIHEFPKIPDVILKTNQEPEEKKQEEQKTTDKSKDTTVTKEPVTQTVSQTKEPVTQTNEKAEDVIKLDEDDIKIQKEPLEPKHDIF